MDRIVCAAIKVPTDTGYVTICGARHFDPIMHKQLAYIKDSGKFSNTERIEQGFINQKGEFFSREEAYLIAYIAGQIINPLACINSGATSKLFSEGLY